MCLKAVSHPWTDFAVTVSAFSGATWETQTFSYTWLESLLKLHFAQRIYFMLLQVLGSASDLKIKVKLRRRRTLYFVYSVLVLRRPGNQVRWATSVIHGFFHVKEADMGDSPEFLSH